MTVKWEDREYQVLVSGGPLGTPANYKFRMARQVASGDAYFYSIVLSNGSSNPPHPFTGVVMLPQCGRQLIHYIRPDDRLVPGTANYPKQLSDLLDEIIHSKIEADPDGYDRLVATVTIQGTPNNLVTLYKVENTHSTGELLVVLLVRAPGASPTGSIGIIGR
jgi:hypothetical protein